MYGHAFRVRMSTCNVTYGKIIQVFDGPTDCWDIEKKLQILSLYFKAMALFQEIERFTLRSARIATIEP